MSDRPNVLLVVLDSVRAENTSLHGYERETTPFLSAFADRATVYTQARAPSIHSIASHVSMFTGTHVEEHEATHHTAHIDTTGTIWHELATEYDYATGLFTNNRIVSNASNLGECFEEKHEPAYPLAERLENTLGNPLVESAYYRLSDGFSRVAAATRRGLERTGLDSLVDGVAGRIGGGTDSTDDGGYKTEFGGRFADAFSEWEARQDGPWAACLNLMDAHSPYQPEPAYDEWAGDEHRRIQREDEPSVRDTLHGRGWDQVEALLPLYDGGIRQADAVVEGLVEDLERRGVLDDTLLIITSDHGEGFGEESQVDPEVRLRGHKWGIHEALTHVPLLVRYPEGAEGRVVRDVVSLTDIPAAIRGTIDGDSDEDPFVTEGPVLASTFRLPEKQTAKFASVSDIDRYVGPWRAVYETREDTVRKFARKGDNYVTVDASGEATVVSRTKHTRVDDVYDSLSGGGVVTDRTTEIDDELEEKLEDLGYIR